MNNASIPFPTYFWQTGLPRSCNEFGRVVWCKRTGRHRAVHSTEEFHYKQQYPNAIKGSLTPSRWKHQSDQSSAFKLWLITCGVRPQCRFYSLPGGGGCSRSVHRIHSKAVWWKQSENTTQTFCMHNSCFFLVWVQSQTTSAESGVIHPG